VFDNIRLDSVMKKNIEDYKFLFEERAAIYEYDGGYSRMAADNRAMGYIKELYAKENNISYDSKEMKLFVNVMKSKRPDKII
jgi:hypothetical protein